MLKEHQDAVGRAYLDYHNGKLDAGVTIDRDDGYSEIGMECWANFTDFPDWPAHQQEAMKHVKGRVLDVGCGAGRHALYLQRKGHDVLGIDESPLAIQVCKARGLKHAEVLRFTQVSSKLGTFDTILMMGNNFGLFGSPKRARWLLRRLHKLTSPDALIVGETLDPYRTSEPTHLAYHELNRSRGRMGGQIRLRARYDGLTSPWLDYLFASRDELTELLDGTGWQVRELIDSDRPIYVAVIGKS